MFDRYVPQLGPTLRTPPADIAAQVVPAPDAQPFFHPRPTLDWFADNQSDRQHRERNRQPPTAPERHALREKPGAKTFVVALKLGQISKPQRLGPIDTVAPYAQLPHNRCVHQ